MKQARDAKGKCMSINNTGHSADQHTQGPRLPSTEYVELARAWHSGNGGGMGYAVGEPTDGANGLNIGEQIHVAEHAGEIAVYVDSAGHKIGVGYVNGPWAVDIDQQDDRSDEA